MPDFKSFLSILYYGRGISYNSAFIVIEILELIRMIFEIDKSEQSQKCKKKN